MSTPRNLTALALSPAGLGPSTAGLLSPSGPETPVAPGDGNASCSWRLPPFTVQRLCSGSGASPFSAPRRLRHRCRCGCPAPSDTTASLLGFLAAFLRTQPASDPLASPVQAAAADDRCQLSYHSGADPALQLQGARRLPGPAAGVCTGVRWFSSSASCPVPSTTQHLPMRLCWPSESKLIQCRSTSLSTWGESGRPLAPLTRFMSSPSRQGCYGSSSGTAADSAPSPVSPAPAPPSDCRDRSRLHQADLADPPIRITEHHLTAPAKAEVVVTHVARTIGVGLGRSEVAALALLPVGLLVVDPQERHVRWRCLCCSRAETGEAPIG